MEIPSIWICPKGSARRNNIDMRDDLPAPVRPTIPIWQEVQERWGGIEKKMGEKETKIKWISMHQCLHFSYTFSAGLVESERFLNTSGRSCE